MFGGAVRLAEPYVRRSRKGGGAAGVAEPRVCRTVVLAKPSGGGAVVGVPHPAPKKQTNSTRNVCFLPKN